MSEIDSQLFLLLMISAINGPIDRVTILFENGMLLETELVVIILSIFEFSILLMAMLSHKTYIIRFFLTVRDINIYFSCTFSL